MAVGPQAPAGAGKPMQRVWEEARVGLNGGRVEWEGRAKQGGDGPGRKADQAWEGEGSMASHGPCTRDEIYECR